jgi:hypothetical protein
MVISEAKTLLKRYGFSDEDPLTLWLNAAMQNLLMEHDWSWRFKIAFLDDQVTDTLDPALAAGVSIEAIQSLTVYDGIGWWKKLQYIAPTEYARDHPDEIVAGTPVGRPCYYTRIGDIIRVTPADPSLNLAYRLVYVPTAVDLTRIALRQHRGSTDFLSPTLGLVTVAGWLTSLSLSAM